MIVSHCPDKKPFDSKAKLTGRWNKKHFGLCLCSQWGDQVRARVCVGGAEPLCT